MHDQKIFYGTHYFEKWVLISEFQNVEFYKESRS